MFCQHSIPILELPKSELQWKLVLVEGSASRDNVEYEGMRYGDSQIVTYRIELIDLEIWESMIETKPPGTYARIPNARHTRLPQGK